jgi:acyl carrier protein
MTKDRLDQRLLEVLGRYLTDPKELQAVRDGRPLLGKTSLDSLSLLNLVTELELLFNVRFDTDTYEQALQDYASLKSFLEKPGNRGAAGGPK